MTFFSSEAQILDLMLKHYAETEDPRILQNIRHLLRARQSSHFVLEIDFKGYNHFHHILFYPSMTALHYDRAKSNRISLALLRVFQEELTPAELSHFFITDSPDQTSLIRAIQTKSPQILRFYLTNLLELTLSGEVSKEQFRIAITKVHREGFNCITSTFKNNNPDQANILLENLQYAMRLNIIDSETLFDLLTRENAHGFSALPSALAIHNPVLAKKLFDFARSALQQGILSASQYKYFLMHSGIRATIICQVINNNSPTLLEMYCNELASLRQQHPDVFSASDHLQALAGLSNGIPPLFDLLKLGNIAMLRFYVQQLQQTASQEFMRSQLLAVTPQRYTGLHEVGFSGSLECLEYYSQLMATYFDEKTAHSLLATQANISNEYKCIPRYPSGSSGHPMNLFLDRFRLSLPKQSPSAALLEAKKAATEAPNPADNYIQNWSDPVAPLFNYSLFIPGSLDRPRTQLAQDEKSVDMNASVLRSDLKHMW